MSIEPARRVGEDAAMLEVNFSRTWRHAVCVACLPLLALGCATGIETGGDADAGASNGNGNGGGNGGFADASATLPDGGGFGTEADGGDNGGGTDPDDPRVTLTHNEDTSTILSVAETPDEEFAGCFQFEDGVLKPLRHRDATFFKVFDPSDFGVTGDLRLLDFRIGILAVENGPVGDLEEGDLQVRFRHQADPRVPDPDNQGTEDIAIFNSSFPAAGTGDGQIDYPSAGVGFALTGGDDLVVPAGRSLLFELALPDGLDDDQLVLLGVNSGGQLRDTFLESPPCENEDFEGITAFSDIPARNEGTLENHHWIVQIEAQELP